MSVKIALDIEVACAGCCWKLQVGVYHITWFRV